MAYNINEAARITGLTPYTLRYYDNEGLLPLVERDQLGNRIFKEGDFKQLALITELKKCGMPVKEISRFMKWLMDENVPIHQRLAEYQKQRYYLCSQMLELETHLDRIIVIIENYQKRICECMTLKS